MTKVTVLSWLWFGYSLVVAFALAPLPYIVNTFWKSRKLKHRRFAVLYTFVISLMVVVSVVWWFVLNSMR